MYMPAANPRSSQPMPCFQKMTTARTTATSGRTTTSVALTSWTFEAGGRDVSVHHFGLWWGKNRHSRDSDR